MSARSVAFVEVSRDPTSTEFRPDRSRACRRRALARACVATRVATPYNQRPSEPSTRIEPACRTSTRNVA